MSSEIKENLLNLPSTPDDELDDREYTEEKVVPLMMAFLGTAAQQNKTQFKLSECKATMSTISEKYLQLGVELLIERGVVRAPQGRSRVPLYEIAVSAVPVTKPAAAAAARETKKEKEAKETKKIAPKPVSAPAVEKKDIEQEQEEEKIAAGKKRKSEPLREREPERETERESERADKPQSMVSPPSAKKKKADKKVYITLSAEPAAPMIANAAPATTTAVDNAPAPSVRDFEASELESELAKFNEHEETATVKPAYAALFEPTEKSEEEKALEEREKQLEQAVADRLLALQVDVAPLSLFVQSVLADRPHFTEEDVRRMLDTFQDRNNIMIDGESIYVI